MSISLGRLAALREPIRATIHSFEHSLYQLTVTGKGIEHLVLEDSGKTFRRRSINAVKEALAGLAIEKLTLKQQSAYDEMIGQPLREGCNTLEVQLAVPDCSQPD